MKYFMKINQLKLGLLTLLSAISIIAGVVFPAQASAITPTATTFAASVPAQCKKSFFGLQPWYAYLGDEFNAKSGSNIKGGKCDIKCFNLLPQSRENDCGQKRSDVPYVLLAIIDSLLRIAGIVAVAFVIAGALKYITSQGDPEGVASAQNTVANALIGLAIALVSVAFVSFVGSRL